MFVLEEIDKAAGKIADIKLNKKAVWEAAFEFVKDLDVKGFFAKINENLDEVTAESFKAMMGCLLYTEVYQRTSRCDS